MAMPPGRPSAEQQTPAADAATALFHQGCALLSLGPSVLTPCTPDLGFGVHLSNQGGIRNIRKRLSIPPHLLFDCLLLLRVLDGP